MSDDAAVYAETRDPAAFAAAFERILGDATVRAVLASRGVARAARMTRSRTAESTLGVLTREASIGGGA